MMGRSALRLGFGLDTRGPFDLDGIRIRTQARYTLEQEYAAVLARFLGKPVWDALTDG
jgi:hypothetical protein